MTKNLLKIPYGLTDFVAIRKECYYIDKTRSIEDLEREDNYALILRPRRFGKSLFMVMLQSYYDIAYADKFETLFNGLHIGDNPTENHSKYLVLRFNFSVVNPNKEYVIESFHSHVLLSLSYFAQKYESYLPSGTADQLKGYMDYTTALRYILEQVKASGQRIYLMIDEYDNFSYAMMTQSKEEYLKFMRESQFFYTFFDIVRSCSPAVIERIYLTGVSSIPLCDGEIGLPTETFYKGANDMLGFTQEETTALLTYYGANHQPVDKLLADLDTWYGGYRFSVNAKDSVLNPVLIFYYLCNKSLHFSVDPNASVSPYKFKRILGEFGNDECLNIVTSIMENRTQDLPSNLKDSLFQMGLLTYGKDSTDMVIPNKSVYAQYQRFKKDLSD